MRAQRYSCGAVFVAPLPRRLPWQPPYSCRCVVRRLPVLATARSRMTRRSLAVAYVWWATLGCFGAHRFYLGRRASASALLLLALLAALALAARCAPSALACAQVVPDALREAAPLVTAVVGALWLVDALALPWLWRAHVAPDAVAAATPEDDRRHAKGSDDGTAQQPLLAKRRGTAHAHQRDVRRSRHAGTAPADADVEAAVSPRAPNVPVRGAWPASAAERSTVRIDGGNDEARSNSSNDPADDASGGSDNRRGNSVARARAPPPDHVDTASRTTMSSRSSSALTRDIRVEHPLSLRRLAQWLPRSLWRSGHAGIAETATSYEARPDGHGRRTASAGARTNTTAAAAAAAANVVAPQHSADDVDREAATRRWVGVAPSALVAAAGDEGGERRSRASRSSVRSSVTSRDGYETPPPSPPHGSSFGPTTTTTAGAGE